MSYKRLSARFFQGVLTLLGFSSAFSCNHPDEYGPEPTDLRELYGPPIEEFRDSVPQPEQPADVKPVMQEADYE